MTKDVRLTIRFTPKQWEQIENSIKAHGKKPSTFCRDLLLSSLPPTLFNEKRQGATPAKNRKQKTNINKSI